MFNFEIFSSILLILVAVNPTLSIQCNYNKTKEKFQNLRYCLTANGVNQKNIIRRNNGDKYTALNFQWNTINHVTPMAYLVANGVSDVRNAIVCCRLLKIRPVARSGGQSYGKASFGDSCSLVIDLTKLNKITIDRTTMSLEIGPGAQIGYIHYNLWKKGKFMIPTGVCPAVGISGLTLGGGWGYFSRRLGLTADNSMEFEMLDARGKLLRINKRTNKDLFWALRGGGGGSFGIVTNFKFRMYLAPKYVAYGVYRYNLDDFPEFFYEWQSLVTSNLTNDIGMYMSLEKYQIELRICHVNVRTKATNFDKLLQKFSFPKSIYSWTNVLTYPEFLVSITQQYSTATLSQISQLANITTNRFVGYTKVKSIYVDKILTKHEIRKLHYLLSEFLQWSLIYVELYGGAINQVFKSDTAFIHRGKTLYNIQLKLFISEGDGKQNLKAMETAMKNIYEQSKVILNHRESYQNYLDPDIPDYLERYYGAHLKRLIRIKTKIDPKNIFHHPWSIPANFSYV